MMYYPTTEFIQKWYSRWKVTDISRLPKFGFQAYKNHDRTIWVWSTIWKNGELSWGHQQPITYGYSSASVNDYGYVYKDCYVTSYASVDESDSYQFLNTPSFSYGDVECM